MAPHEKCILLFHVCVITDFALNGSKAIYNSIFFINVCATYGGTRVHVFVGKYILQNLISDK